MNILITTGDAFQSAVGEIDVFMTVATNSGMTAAGTARINFSNSTVQLNNNLIAQGKQILLDSFGYTTVNTDIIKLMGGAI